MSLITSRTICSRSTQALVVTSPATMATPVLTRVSNGYASVFVLGNDGIQYSVGDLVSDLVWVSFRHGFGGEKGVFAHLYGFPEMYRW